MLTTARRDHPGIEFVAGDIAAWSPAEPYDLVFSNAALQWVGNHAGAAPRLIAAVKPGGVLAVQMPRNHDFATHALMRRVAAEGPWRERLAGARDPSPVKPPEFYYDCLAPLSRRVMLWETNYIQVMDGVGAIIAWLHGTGLGPFLGRLDARPSSGNSSTATTASRRRLPAASRRQDAAALPAAVLHRHAALIGYDREARGDEHLAQPGPSRHKTASLLRGNARLRSGHSP